MPHGTALWHNRGDRGDETREIKLMNWPLALTNKKILIEMVIIKMS
ncbi:uncharacterized protein CELE_Y52B11A.20 [Caenorhabditis elegans]|uniref:Uncharacterized protein n=1 Tax=Caenorhabditis elegans TaxID=6239 RepID=I2HAH3_CAEEL|nr:Uncharacterized protein CELE_Y52B11A.20 [Caenorhabditis elegans]CCH63901.1 Uncharacterized protein CELE_Y52B11A.20 [Caenorhabditis elegans]|eukprot:NP_001263487.1 Uncharacterized protein CELE_Y52B11A.20 [Caenorhabditis elegans]